ncbi:MAG: Phosphate-binding protein PstS precursor [Microbacterium sp.]|nr:Phosphate-binding protein PstS precursor [Microbacterium sp.]
MHIAAATAIVIFCLAGVSPVQAASSSAISGSGSTWAQNALDQWRRHIAAQAGVTVSYSGTGSIAGRGDFVKGTVDFAVSELPFQRSSADGAETEVPPRRYTYVPFVAGGTALAYHLTANGKPVTDLRLTGEVIAKIFSGIITNWADPAISAVNPGIALPDREIIPVVRADTSGSTAQFTRWLDAEHPTIWTRGETQEFPVPSSTFTAQNGSLGVAGYVSQNYGEGAITYVESAYAERAGLPMAAVQNRSGRFVPPSAEGVTAALAGAEVNQDAASVDHQTQVLDGVYRNLDPAAYPISSYAYLIVPTETGGVFDESKGATLAAFARYVLCTEQQHAHTFGYAPLPANLVATGLGQVARIPGAGAEGCGGAGEGAIGLEATVLGGVDGALSLAMPIGATAVLAPDVPVDGARVSTGALPSFWVEDGRTMSRPGYTVHSSTTEFVAGNNRMPASSLTIAPLLRHEQSDASGVEVSAPFAASTVPRIFASAMPGDGVGTTVFGGVLRLVASADAPAGTYRSTLTVTLVSR